MEYLVGDRVQVIDQVPLRRVCSVEQRLVEVGQRHVVSSVGLRFPLVHGVTVPRGGGSGTVTRSVVVMLKV
jgi:hypothetical protein